jgi:hypothetical protein
MTVHRITILSNSSGTRLTPNGIHSGVDFTIQNVNESAYVYIGGEGVSTSDYGYRISPGHAISFELPGKDAMYAISNIDEAEVAIIEVGLESGS